MNRIFQLLMLTSSLTAAEHWQVDQPQDWYRFDVSHHGKHFEGGVVLGAATYAGASLFTDSRAWRFGDAVLAGAVIGMSYEVVEGRDGKSYVDPVDAAWVTLGSAVGAVVADATGQAISFVVHHDKKESNFAVAWSKKF